MFVKRLIAGLVSLVAMMGATFVAVGPASASPKVDVGGGAGIMMRMSATKVAYCSLGTIGYDRDGSLVGITAKHCAVNRDVYSERYRGAGVIGQYVASARSWDFAVIKFDKSKVNPVRTYRGVTISGVGADPVLGDTVCATGRTTGTSCGIAWGTNNNTPFKGNMFNQTCPSQGDSGGPIRKGNKVVGIVNGITYVEAGGYGLTVECGNPGNPVHFPIDATSINTIIKILNRNDVPGNGFRPV